MPGTLSPGRGPRRSSFATRVRGTSTRSRWSRRFDGVRLFDGKVADVERRTVAGFARGQARLEGLDADAGSTLTLRFQNELLIASATARWSPPSLT